MEAGSKDWVRFLVYVHYSHEVHDPHSWTKRKCAALVV